ncbi:MAG: sulfotransferase [Elusimicrobiota bacterium]|nr:MAG: sulfotransferase [Elusimicrobiota bacterium]
MNALAYAPRARLFEDFIIVEGITRAGKFLAAVVVSAFEGVEPVQYSPNLESLLVLHRLGKVDMPTAKLLLEMEFDIRAFDMAMGRYLNTRPDDMSSVFRSPDHENVLARAKELDRDALLARFHAEKRLPLHLYHEGLPHARALFGVFPKARVVSSLRDPAALMNSWYNRGWGKLGTAESPTVMWPFFQTAKGMRTWWSVDWAEDWSEINDMDRCALSIASLYELGRRELEECAPALRERIHFLRFEDLVRDPLPRSRASGGSWAARPCRAWPGRSSRSAFPGKSRRVCARGISNASSA